MVKKKLKIIERRRLREAEEQRARQATSEIVPLVLQEPLPIATRTNNIMADMSVENLVASKPFRFLVGTEKKEFMMHSNLVAKMSSPLDALINGSMKEAKEGVAHFSEVDEAAFTRFFQFAYRGDYEVAGLKLALPKICEDPQHKVKANSSGFRTEDYWSRSWGSCDDCERKPCICPSDGAQAEQGALHNAGTDGSKVSKLWKGFIEESGIPFTTLTSREILDIPTQCWSDILLAHARVYVFADCYSIDSLADLSKKKLHQALVLFELQKDNVDQITALVDYVCRNTLEADELRALLCRYCAYNIQQLSPDDKFSALLAEMGDFSSAVIKQLLQRLS